MDSVDQLAKMLVDMHRQNINPPSTACRIGTVVEASPLKIKWGDKIVLTEEQLIVPRLYQKGYSIPYRWQDTKGKMMDAEIMVKVELKKGDEVIIAPDSDLQQFYVLGGL